MRIKLTIIFIGFFFAANSQTNDNIIRRDVLKKNKVGKEFVFGKWNEKGETETHLTYLGKVKTKSGKIYKVMNSTWIWGLSCRATNRILIFNEKNQYLGNYRVTLVSDLPSKLKNGNLIFENLNSDCDKKVISEINLTIRLPKQFFRECKDGYGDIYSFDGTN